MGQTDIWHATLYRPDTSVPWPLGGTARTRAALAAGASRYACNVC